MDGLFRVIDLFLSFFTLAGRSCWCADRVFACQVLAIIQLDHVLGFFFMFKLLHVLVDRVVVFVCVVLPDVLYPDTSWQVALSDVLQVTHVFEQLLSLGDGR